MHTGKVTIHEKLIAGDVQGQLETVGSGLSLPVPSAALTASVG